MNDYIINTKKIGRFLGENKRKNKDRGYSREEINRILDVADLRMKCVVLLMASTGMRIGPVTYLQLKHIEEIPQYKCTKLLYTKILKMKGLHFALMNVMMQLKDIWILDLRVVKN
jgi:integrase